MALTNAQLLALKTTLVASFNRGLVAQNGDWAKIAKTIPSSGASNTYGWLSQFPAFREWVGSRLHKAIAETAYSVNNKMWESTLDVPRTSIEDDAFGHYGAIAESYGEAVDDLRSALVFGALNSGFAALCYDGQYFFDTDHPVAPNEDGTGVATTVSNYQAGALEPWYLLCNKRAARPIYLQERTKPEFYSAMSLDSPLVFDYDTYSFGARYRSNAAYGFWQCAHGSKAAFSEANFNLMYDAILTRLGDGNRKLGLVPDTLVVGPTNRAAAETLILARELVGGGTNTNFNRVDLIVSPWVA